MIGVQCHWWFVEDILEHLRVHFKFFCGWRFYGKLTFSFNFALWSSFQIRFDSKQNRIISISSGLIEFCCFGLPVALGRGQVGGGVSGASGGMGGVPPHMHAHARTHTYTHVYMYRNCKWPPTWRHPCLAWLACLTCMCVCVHVCVHWTPPHTHTQPHPMHPSATPPGGGPPESVKIR